MAEALRLASFAMGTRFEVVVRHGDVAHARAAGEAALAEIERWHDLLSVFDRSSFLSFVNTHAHERAIGLDAELFALLSLCREVWRASGGAFDPTIASEMVKLGLHDRPQSGGGPVGFDAIILDESARTIRLAHEGVSIDLGGVAKGFALDRAADVLRECGIEHAFIHGGTSSGVALGYAEEQGTPWRVVLGVDQGAPCRDLIDSAYSVSSPSGRVAGGTHHILDPRGGEVDADRCAAVWCGMRFGPSIGVAAALCDAWSTAMVVLGHRPSGMPMTMGSAVRAGGVWRDQRNTLDRLAGAGAA
ncbi:MAG: FAD:protein FMN transferase [Phycisphaeraceae bacterium]|nr:FAD:protein FMN transferase [Phycisphaerales bacterium]MCB9843159.1 FAD:protein FMN transferase [Phycisphaeraceae bacterium]